jgi:radical SAM protein with 4Fe4S-binding SPASM domain
MGWDVFEAALSQAGALGVPRLVFHTTGESLLHKELPRMVRVAKERRFQVFLSTNGMLLDKRRATELLEAGLDQLRFSIEGASKETYEAVRVGGRHDRLLANMQGLRRLRDETHSPMGITVNSVYMKETAPEVEQFYRTYGPLVDHIEWTYLGNQGNHMPEIVARSSTVPTRRRAVRPCDQLWRSLVVSWNGDVTVCCVDLENEMTVGNVLRDTLGRIWRNEQYQRYRRLHLEGRQAELKLCGGCTSIQRYTSPYNKFLLNRRLRALGLGEPAGS